MPTRQHELLIILQQNKILLREFYSAKLSEDVKEYRKQRTFDTLAMSLIDNPVLWTESYLGLLSRMPANRPISWSAFTLVFGRNLTQSIKGDTDA